MRLALWFAVPLLLAGCQSTAPISAPPEPVGAPPSEQAPPRAAAVESGSTAAPADGQPVGQDTYTSEEIVQAAASFFGKTTAEVAKAVEHVFAEYGRPNAYIIGEEGSGAMVVGLRYGQGTLSYKGGGSMPVYWQGPSVGWDWGGNASKVFTLVYNLRYTSQLFQRFPAVDGSLYVMAGLGVNYQRSGNIILAPMRTGVGLRAGASLGYVHYTRERSLSPF